MSATMKKRAVISGASSGIGRAFAIALGKEGWKVGIADIDLIGAAGTLELVQSKGGNGEIFQCNVALLSDLEKIADHVFHQWGGVDLLINNAGLACFGAMGELMVEQWRRIMDVNLWGVINGCHAFVPRMKVQKHGHIVNVASIAGLIPVPESIAYNTTKFAVVGLSETLFTELAPYGIGVTVVCPSVVNTNIFNQMIINGAYTRDWHCKYAACDRKKVQVTAEELARKVLRDVKKKKIYSFPQSDAKIGWYAKRLAPSMLIRYLSRKNLRNTCLKPSNKKLLRRRLYLTLRTCIRWLEEMYEQ